MPALGKAGAMASVARPDRVEQHGREAKRLAAALLVGAAVLAAAVSAGAVWSVAVTAGWDAAALVFLVSVWGAVGRLDAAGTRRRALADDVSRPAADATLLSAAVASLVAVGFVLSEAGSHHGTAKVLLVALALASVALAWASVHSVFALRYGCLYYQPPVGGIGFHEDDPPDYRDFAYVALTVGMTFQVSDTDLCTKPIRRTATRHALLSFLFGAVILAVTINVVASLLGH